MINTITCADSKQTKCPLFEEEMTDKSKWNPLQISFNKCKSFCDWNKHFNISYIYYIISTVILCESLLQVIATFLNGSSEVDGIILQKYK